MANYLKYSGVLTNTPEVTSIDNKFIIDIALNINWASDTVQGNALPTVYSYLSIPINYSDFEITSISSFFYDKYNWTINSITDDAYVYPQNSNNLPFVTGEHKIWFSIAQNSLIKNTGDANTGLSVQSNYAPYLATFLNNNSFCFFVDGERNTYKVRNISIKKPQSTSTLFFNLLIAVSYPVNTPDIVTNMFTKNLNFSNVTAGALTMSSERIQIEGYKHE